MKKLICFVLVAVLLTACGAEQPKEAATISAQIGGEEVVFSALEGDVVPAEGNYYLTKDLELAEKVTLTGDLNLHLNGHTITAAHGAILGHMFHIPEGMTMMVYDVPVEEDVFVHFDPELESEEDQDITVPEGGAIVSSRSFSGKMTISSIFKVEGKLIVAGGHIDATEIHLENKANGVVAYVTGSMEVCGGIITGGTTWRFLDPAETQTTTTTTTTTTTPAETTPATTAPAETTPATTVPAETTAATEAAPAETVPEETVPEEEIIPGEMGLGGAIYVADGGECRISGGVIWGGSAYQGGNVYVAEGGLLNITEGVLLGGEATKAGGNVFVAGTMEMAAGILKYGDSYGDGGNLFVCGQLNMTGGELLGGEADMNAKAYRYGGNLAVDGLEAVIKIQNARILDGTAACKESHGGNIAVIRYAAKEFEVSDSYIYGGLGHRGGNVYVGHFSKSIPEENTDCVFTRVEMNGGNTTYRGANMCSDTKNAERPVRVTFNDCIMGVEDASEVNLAIGAGASDVTQCIITINGGTFTGGGLSLYGSSVTTATGVTFVDCAAGGTGEYIENP